MTGELDDSYATFIVNMDGVFGDFSAEIYFYFNDVVNALADMLRRARS